MLKISVDREKFMEKRFYRFFARIVFPQALYVLAALVAVLNFLLIFDNVLWGDEAYAGSLILNKVSGIFQVLTLEENHPPLYYLWLKMFAEIFGYTGPVYHFASYVPFLIGIIMAVTLFKKHFGKMPAAFFVIISGLSAPCVQFNMEIRMYQMAFLGVIGSFYCAYRILDENKNSAWAGMVFWALVAAYSHYYALVCVGIMMFVTFMSAFMKYRKKTWVKGVLAMLVFIAAYAPWLAQLFRATKSVSGNWWMDEIEPFSNSIRMVGCGDRFSKITLPVVILLLLVVIIAESGIFFIQKDKDNSLVLNITVPTMKNWSAETYAMVVGFLSIAGTIVFAYGISFLMTPLISTRYFYVLCGITAMMLCIGYSRLLGLINSLGEKLSQKWLAGACKALLFLILALLFFQGAKDYAYYRAVVNDEKAKTEETLELIGAPVKNQQFINDGIQHIGWTVLHYYYPEAKITNGGWGDMDSGDVWYFTPNELFEEDVREIEESGYEVTFYNRMQISKYSFLLYHFKNILQLD